MATPEDLQAEQQILDTIQLEHQRRMDAAGVLGRAFEQLDLDEALFVKPVLVQGTETGDNGEKVTVTELKVGVSQLHDPTDRHMQHRYFPIARKIGDIAIPVAPFTTDDVQLVGSLTDGLRAAKDMEVLPNLSDDLGSIFNPDVELSKIQETD